MPNPTAGPASPNDVLAAEIADALVAGGLITEDHKPSLLQKLKVGGVQQEDWNLWIDMATAPEVAQGEASNE